MFKQFWELKRHIIEPTAIVAALGAIFLSISEPENIQARDVLVNIQFIWLILIILSIIILFANFWWFSVVAEKEIKKYSKVDLTNSVSFAIAILALWLTVNLWKYAWALYPNQAKTLVLILWASMPFVAIIDFAQKGWGIGYKILISLALFSLWIAILIFLFFNINPGVLLFVKYFVIVCIVSAFVIPFIGWLSIKLKDRR